MPITTLPPAPQRQDEPDLITQKADAMFSALPTFVTEANALEVNVNAKELSANAAATTATTKAAEALASANAADISEAAALASANAAAASAVEADALVEKYLGALATDPTTDKTGGPLTAGDWYVNTGSGLIRAYNGTAWVNGISTVAGVNSVNGKTGDVSGLATTADLATKASLTGTEKLTNKTVSGVFIDKTYINAAVSGTLYINIGMADVFNLTLSGNTTVGLTSVPTLSNETFAFVMRVNQGSTAYTLTWFSGITWLTTGGTAPAAPSASKSVEYIFSTTDGTNWTGRKGAAN